MISIPLTEDRSSPIEFEVEEWEPSWAAAEREVLKLKRLIDKEKTMEEQNHSYALEPAEETQPAISETPLPCPFCGSDDISEGEVLTIGGAGGTVTQSMCNTCGALGPEARLPEGEVDYGDVRATAAWNRRVRDASAKSDEPILKQMGLRAS
jgi:hypothetical protein